MQIELSKQDTMRIIFSNNQNKFFFNKLRYKTKTKSNCLHCGDNILIDYDANDISCIFCEDCKERSDYTNIVQQQYFRLLKTRQLELIEKLLNNST